MNAKEELNRLKKATVYADILDAGGITADRVDSFETGQWGMVALITQNEALPSPETRKLVSELLHQRSAWRKSIGSMARRAHA